MKLKLSQIIEAREPLRRLAGEKFPATIAYRIQRNLRNVDPEIRTYETTRESLIKERFGVHDEEAKSWHVPPENMETFAQEINALLEEEIEIDIWQIDLASLKEMTPADMMALEWMITPPPEENNPTPVNRFNHRKRNQKVKV